jgi:hypothetical protein
MVDGGRSAENMNSDITSDLRSLASGVRAVALVFTLVLSYFNARLAFQINNFDTIFSHMLGGKPLPAVTDMVLRGRTILVLLSLLTPVFAVVIVARLRNHKLALYSLSGLMIAAFIQIHLTWTGLFAPLMSIINGMRSQ